MDKKTFSEWLFDELKEREISQSELARRSGLSRQSISDYIIGKRNNPEPEALNAIARALKESPLTLYMAAGIYTPTEIDEALIDRHRLLLKRLSPQKRVELEEIGWLFVKLEESAPSQEGVDQAKK